MEDAFEYCWSPRNVYLYSCRPWKLWCLQELWCVWRLTGGLGCQLEYNIRGLAWHKQTVFSANFFTCTFQDRNTVRILANSSFQVTCQIFCFDVISLDGGFLWTLPARLIRCDPVLTTRIWGKTCRRWWIFLWMYGSKRASTSSRLAVLSMNMCPLAAEAVPATTYCSFTVTCSCGV